MSGNGRCQRRRKMMPRAPDDDSPAPPSRVPASEDSLDFYSQALKALSERSPFDPAEASTTTVTTLPTALGTGLLARHSDGRKRHKKSNADPNKSSKHATAERPKSSAVWIQYEEYFRELSVSDIDTLRKWSTSLLEFLVSDSCLLIPCLGNIVDSGNVVTVQENCAAETSLHEEETVIDKDEEHELEQDQEKEQPMEIDVLGPVAVDDTTSPQQLDSGSSLEWVLGSRDKVLLSTERPTKKRKLLGERAGLQRLVVAKSCKGKSGVCHFCSLGDKGDQLNQLVVCGSCDICVHQKCYGIQGDADESWTCSWCKWKSGAGGGKDPSELGQCVLCPKSGGALKPVQRGGTGNGVSMEFAHLFCSLWMPEVYVDDMRMMEPILNVDRIKETRKKLICYLCKVRKGTCVRCTDGACRTSFHPICAREAGHRLEVWGKLGCEDVELRAFCFKHSHGCDEGESIPGTVSSSPPPEIFQQPLLDKPSLDDGGGIRRDHIAGCLEELDDSSNKEAVAELKKEIEDGNLSAKCGVEHTNLPEFTDKESQERSMSEVVNPPDFLDISLILKKLIDLGKVSLKDLASEISVPADSLAANIANNHLPPELRCKLVKWLGDHAFTETTQKKLTVKISVPAKVEMGGGEDGSPPVTVKQSSTCDVRVKSVPSRRTISSVSVRTVKDDDILSSCKDPNLENRRISDNVRAQLPVTEVPSDSREEIISNNLEKVVFEHTGLQGSSAPISPISLSNPFGCLEYDGHGSVKDNGNVIRCSAPVVMAEGIPSHSASDADRPYATNTGSESSSYIHPYVQKKIMEIQSGAVKKSCKEHDGPLELYFSHSKQSLTNGGCSKWDDPDVSYVDVVGGGKGITLDTLNKAKEKGILDLHPEDDVEGELIYFQNWLFGHSAKRKRLSDNLICKIVKNLPQELQMVRKQRWDSVLVHQYLHEIREAKKQGRKERKYREAQEILAAATAAAAASSRTSFRKDGVDEASQQQDNLSVQITRGRAVLPSLATPRVKETASSLMLSRNMPDKHLDILRLNARVSKEHPKFCDICGRTETILNPILICSNCKVSVHLVCYRNVKESTGPWYCELCEDSPPKGSIVHVANSSDRPNLSTECSLCGTSNGAFRKTTNGLWVHALCAEWVFESTIRRGQANPIEGMESVVRGNDICSVCHQRVGVCIKCNFGPCQSAFHPSCAKSAGYCMTARSVGGKQQHKAYCDKHSIEQRAKVEGQKHGVEELKSLKQIRVELEKLRLICERIIKREKLKRETIICSHDLLASKKDTLAFSPLFQSPFFPPEASSESATTSLKGQTDCSRSCSTMQKSDDVTVDSTVSGKRRIKLLVSTDTDQRTDDSSTSQQLPTPKPADRVSFSGKHLPLRASLTRRNNQETGGKMLRSRKPETPETFEKELIMTSDQASVKNQRLPKGYIYVPIDRLSTEEQSGEDSLGPGQ